MINLPIYDVIPDIQKSLQKNNNLIIEAPAGAGKSTAVPISLINESWLEDKMIIVLEPRRVAARAVASQMAKLLGEKVGQTVGYQIKMENVQSSNTKVLVVTQAILTKKLQSDQALEDVACIIFDEFHERSIHTDLGLALALQSQEMLRDDLKIVLMSATLNSQELEKFFTKVDIIQSQGRMYDVKEVYLEDDIKHPNINEIEELLYKKIIDSIKNDEGDILVFCDGIKLINNLFQRLEELKNKDILVLPLHSNLNKKEQDLAINKNEKRKVILSTNIAQTSLTIDGVKVVIDSGVEKSSLYDDKSGLDILKPSFISSDDSIQRQGRAGRTSEGVCYKLWHKKRILNQSTKPELLRVDISMFLLNAYMWGVENLDELKLLDYPNVSIVNSANELLHNLELIDKNNSITNLGQKVLNLGVNVRLALMILRANELGFAKQACLIASMIENKADFINNSNDFIDEWEYIVNNSSYKVNQIKKQSNIYLKKLENLEEKIEEKKFESRYIGILLLFAYSDRLAKKSISSEVYNLSNKKQARLIKQNSFKNEYLVVSSIVNTNETSYIQKACSVDINLVKEHFSSHIKTIISLETKPKLQFKQKELFEYLVLEQKNINKVPQDVLHEAIYNHIEEVGIENVFDFEEKRLKTLIEKIEFYKNHEDKTLDLSSYTKEALSKNAKEYLSLYLNEVNKFEDLKKIDFYTVLSSLIPWDDIQKLDTLLPNSIKVPSGSNIRLDYSSFDEVILKVKIQEVFGMMSTPKILNNQLALTIYLLNPAQRPIQITKDLDSFWKNSYAEVRAELRGKYKKHYWPENPYEAIATNKTKKNM